MAWRIERWGGHPSGKPWGEWPAGLIERMGVAQNVYNAFSAFGRVKMERQGEWLEDNSRQAKIITRVWELREQHGDQYKNNH